MTDIYVWKIMRRDRGLSGQQTKQAMRELIEPLMERDELSRILAYTSPAHGHLFPLMAILEELRRRGHEVALRTLAGEVAKLRSMGFEAKLIEPSIEALKMDDWKAKTPHGAGQRGRWGSSAPAPGMTRQT